MSEQKIAKHYLTTALHEHRLPNTLLFSGPEGAGKKAHALALASELLHVTPARIESGNSADFHLLSPEGKSGLHSIDSIRKAIDLAQQAPFESPNKVFLVEALERMQPAAANALLKTLEEPHLDTYWILLTSAEKEILPTILSRCARVPFHAPTNPIEEPCLTEAKQILSSLLQAPLPYPKLLQALDSIDKILETEEPLLKQKRAEALFHAIALYYRDQLHASPSLSLPNWEEPLERARLAFERNIKLSTCLETFLLISNKN